MSGRSRRPGCMSVKITRRSSTYGRSRCTTMSVADLGVADDQPVGGVLHRLRELAAGVELKVGRLDVIEDVVEEDHRRCSAELGQRALDAVLVFFFKQKAAYELRDTAYRHELPRDED